ncbi:MAG: winged helix-turn-helix domain-containing protein [Stenotrophomonas sp.]
MTEHFQLGDLRIDVQRQQVARGGTVLDVKGMSFRLLHYLLQQGQRVVGFDELIAQVWAPALVNEETVTQRVRLLRQSLDDDSRQPRYLRSVRGQGYQLCLPAQAVVGVPSLSSARRRRIAIALSIALMLVVIALAAWQWRASLPAASVSPLLQRADYYAGIGQRDNNERAVLLYRQRLQEAPDDMQAMLGLSRAYSARVCQYSGTADDAAQAQRLATQVVSARPRWGAAYAALGYAFDCRGESAQARAAYEQALRHDPGADAVRGSLAYLHERQGHLVEALEANLQIRDPAKVRFLPIQIASNLNLLGYTAAAEARYRDSFRLYPDSVFSNVAWPQFLFAHGRQDEAQAALEEALRRGTGHAGLYLLQAELALARGETDTARQASLHALRLRPQGSLAQTVVWTLGAQPAPPPETLRRRAGELLDGVARGSDPLDGLDAALLLADAGEPAAALTALEHARDAGYRDVAYLRTSPLLAPLRARPGFDALLEGIEADLAAQRMRLRERGLLPGETGAATAAP